ncbi:hypothetical protein HZC21_02625 [Candidatus Peregrinibacteria bacterium]|nr:hypothetical protein [Candidatus Peregrinibacteria bacterium]
MDSYQKFISEKAKYKRKILGKMFLPRQPVLLIDFDGTVSQKQLKDLMEGLSSLKITTLIIGTVSAAYNNMEPSIHFIPESLKSDAYQASDFVIVLNGDIASVLKKGCVPVAQMDGDGTTDYNPLIEKGNGFYFAKPTTWEIFAAVVRALETYKFPYDWENLIREILK